MAEVTPDPPPEADAAEVHYVMLQLARLQQFEKHCEAIWPAIRFFGLCGSHPQYVIAAQEIGRLLGYVRDDSPQVDPAKVAAAARASALEEVAAWAQQAPEISKVAGRKFQSDLADMIRKLPVQAG